jgi:hypothetical protein
MTVGASNPEPAGSEAPAAARALWPQFVVPAILLTGCALSLWDALRLSAMAMALPLALISVIVLALGLALVAAIRDGGPSAAELSEDEPGLGPVLQPTPWTLVLLPLVLALAADFVGMLVALVALVFCAQLLLGSRKLVPALAIALATAVPIYFLFKHVLYVRFPPGLIGIG